MDKIKTLATLEKFKDYYDRHADDYEIYESVQALINELRKEIKIDNAKTSGKVDLYKALSKLIEREENSRIKGICKLTDKDFIEKWCYVSGSLAFIFTQGVLPEGLPVCEGIDVVSFFENGRKYDKSVNIPTLKQLKSEKKYQKEKGYIKKNKIPLMYLKTGNEYNLFNVDLLISAREILGDGASFYCSGRYKDPLYAKSDVGEGIIIPMAIKTEINKELVYPRENEV